MAYLQHEISSILRINDAELDCRRPLNTMGVDSLMAVELRNQIQTDLGIEIPVVKFIGDINTEELANEINEQLVILTNTQAIDSKDNQQLKQKTDTKDNDFLEVEL